MRGPNAAMVGGTGIHANRNGAKRFDMLSTGDEMKAQADEFRTGKARQTQKAKRQFSMQNTVTKSYTNTRVERSK